jgi:hypothetical protein
MCAGLGERWTCDVNVVGRFAVLSEWREPLCTGDVGEWVTRATIPLDEAVKIAATLMAHRKRTHVDEDAVLAMEGG